MLSKRAQSTSVKYPMTAPAVVAKCSTGCGRDTANLGKVCTLCLDGERQPNKKEDSDGLETEHG